MFETGPARAVMAMSLLGFLKFPILTGTGFAQPNLKTIIIKRPMGSICLIGLRVSLPAFFAVLSPSL